MLVKKMLRDISMHKAQFISIFIMAFLAVYVFTGVGGEWIGIKNSSEKFYNDINLADVWLYGNNFDDEKVSVIENIENVNQTERQLIIDVTAEFKNNPEIRLHFIEKNLVSKPYTYKGQDFDINDCFGIWLDKRFAKAKNLNVDDRITLKYNGTTFKNLHIKGLVYSGEYVYLSEGDKMTPDFSSNGFAYMSYKAYEAYPFGDIVYNTLMIKTEQKDMTIFENQINTALQDQYSVFLPKEIHPSVNMFQNEINQHKMIGDIFPFVFFAIALLTILTTMNRIVNAQRLQIGTLKACGFKKAIIYFHYISYGFLISLIGALLGSIAGPFTLPYLIYPSMSSFYTLPVWQPTFDFSFLIVALIVIISCTIVTYLSCYKILREIPAKSLRPKPPKTTKHNFLETTKLWEKLNFNTRWNIRDITRNKSRSLMAIIGVLGCTALLICAFGIYKGNNELKVWQYEDINHFNSKLIIDQTATKQQINNAKDLTQGEYILEDKIEIKANNIKKAGSLTVTDNVSLITNTDKNRNHITLPQGLSITYKIANALGVKKGDTVTFHRYGDTVWKTVTVAGVYREPTNQGITMDKEYFESLGFEFLPTSILTEQNVYTNIEGIKNIVLTEQTIEQWDELSGSMMLMVYIIILAACILSVVVLYNLGLLSFTEMEREMATLKVLGIKTKKLARLIFTQNIWFSVIGFIIGIPLGQKLMQLMVTSSGDFYDFPVDLQFFNLAFSFIITFGVALIVNLLFARKLKKIDMVKALKGFE